MKLLSYAAAALVLMANVAAAQFGPLVSPAELNASLGTNAPVILDIRAPAAAEGQENVNTYRAGHIEGAINAPYGRFRGPAENPGQLPSAEELTALLRELGLRQNHTVVIAHQGANETDFGAAARVYWTLKSAGFGNLSILNGGVAAWTEAGLALGYSSRLAFGCNVGAFFGGISTGSLHGWVWFAAAFVGSIIGVRLRPLLQLEPRT